MECPGKYLFPARSKTSSSFSAWSKSKRALDKLSGVSDWTLHDLRRTFRTGLGRLGVRPDIAERLVNHISARTEMEETYDMCTYLPEMQAAMQLYADWFFSLLANDCDRAAASTSHAA
jgi:integrase